MADEKQQPIIKVYDPEKEVKEAIANLQRQQKIINRAIEAVVIVVAVGFIAMVIAVFAIFIDHQDYAVQKYNDYIELLKEHEQQFQSEMSGQENLDIGTHEEVESNQETIKNNTPLETDKK